MSRRNVPLKRCWSARRGTPGQVPCRGRDRQDTPLKGCPSVPVSRPAGCLGPRPVSAEGTEEDNVGEVENRMAKLIASLMREAERCYARGDFQGGYVLEGFAQRAEEEMSRNIDLTDRIKQILGDDDE